LFGHQGCSRFYQGKKIMKRSLLLAALLAFGLAACDKPAPPPPPPAPPAKAPEAPPPPPPPPPAAEAPKDAAGAPGAPSAGAPGAMDMNKKDEEKK
jgi:hypothetical protein